MKTPTTPISTPKLSTILSFALLISVSACTAKQAPTDTIRYRTITEPPSLDWNVATDNVSMEIIGNLHEGLTRRDSEAKIEPALAESWVVSKDLKTYTFKLRENLKWSDGQPLTAQQFIDGWQRMLTPATAAEYAYFLFDIENAENFYTKKISDFSQVGAKAIDARTLQVKLRAPSAYWLHIPATFMAYPTRLDVIQAKGNRWTEGGNMVSAGPYKLKLWEHENKVVLEKNPYYHRPLPDMVPFVEVRIVKEAATAVQLLHNGDLDIMRDLPPVQMRNLSQTPEFFKTPQLRSLYIGFNVTDPTVSDVKIRKAIAHAIDRKEIEQVVGPTIVGRTAWIPEGMLGFNNDIGLKFDPALAKKLWSEVANKPKTVELMFDPKELHKVIFENIQNQITRVLGVKVSLSTQEWKVLLKTLHTKAPAMWRMGWLADYPDPDNFMNLFTCISGNNFTKFCDKDYDKAVFEASGSPDEAKRVKIYDGLQKTLLEREAALIPLFQEAFTLLIAKRIENFKSNSIGEFRFYEMRIKK